ncbi:hypothetical protein BDN67DRAFT_976436 [Paxillus ammoniavirescens]|nr:hypothetical protein BDN67DRAFT_976436 [Paxillus ammoniavirescens]
MSTGYLIPRFVLEVSCTTLYMTACPERRPDSIWINFGAISRLTPWKDHWIASRKAWVPQAQGCAKPS